MTASRKKLLIFLVKLTVSAGILGAIYWKVFRGQTDELWARAEGIRWEWMVLALGITLFGVSCSVVRWQRLLTGQGIHAPWRHLIGSFMIGRFFGGFMPGTLGLDGYRLYDIAHHTGKTARSTATIGVEKLIGQIAFGAVVIAGSFYGLRYIGATGVALVDGFFVLLMITAILLLSRPGLFRKVGARLPNAIRARLQTTIDAVCAYQGKGVLLLQAVALAIGTHTCHVLTYVAVAHGLGADLGVGDVFFVSAMQIFATLMPASLNGVGIREAAATALYTSVGVPAAIALLIPTAGFIVEMLDRPIGGLIFLARRVGYRVDIRVDDAEREEAVNAAIPAVPPEEWPRLVRGLSVGLGAGLLAGLILGVGEASVIVAGAAGRSELTVFLYGAIAYGIACGAAGAVGGLVLAWSGRLMKRAAVPEPVAYARMTAAMVAVAALALGAFRVRRDVFEEQLVWKSGQGLLVLFACASASLVLYLVLSFVLRRLVAARVGRFMLRGWGSPAVAVVTAAVLGAVTLLGQSAEAAPPSVQRPAAPAQAGNVIVIVVDTLRADHLPAYGYASGRTPHLDAFMADAVRFDQFFANASWTRPSFASFLTGRYPSSHRVMGKSSALPDAVTTLPEALQAHGFYTAGIVTNYNVAPFYNFQQGFDEYRYLEPDFVLGANDTAAKLLFIQFARQKIETIRARMGIVEPGSVYRDAETVNREVFAFLERAPQSPWFLFAAYMDPHDPYFPHPYDGQGYSRAAHPEPQPEEAQMLRELYDGEITYWDEHFGRLVADLRRRGLYEETTIVITSDHGEEFHDHGGFWHGTTLYDEQLRVPMIVKLPYNERGGTVVRHWAQSVDLMPTVLRRMGIEIPEGVQGGDLFRGTDQVFAEESHEGNVLQSLRTRRGETELKLITANAGNPRGLAEVELYRVDQDPGEHVNLEDHEPELTEIAQARLGASTQQAQTGRVAEQATQGQGDTARLRALGYAGGGETN